VRRALACHADASQRQSRLAVRPRHGSQLVIEQEVGSKILLTVGSRNVRSRWTDIYYRQSVVILLPTQWSLGSRPPELQALDDRRRSLRAQLARAGHVAAAAAAAAAVAAARVLKECARYFSKQPYNRVRLYSIYTNVFSIHRRFEILSVIRSRSIYVLNREFFECPTVQLLRPVTLQLSC
jgi:hypothetical protein